MTRKIAVSACLLVGLSAAGCKHETITPMPEVLPSAGLLLRCERVRLAPHLELRRLELLRSNISNDFYPFNVSRAVRMSGLVSKLYVWRAGWKFLDYIELPAALPYEAPNVSPDGRRIVYERPDVSPGEGDFPRALRRDRRTYRAAIYDYVTAQRSLLDRFSEVYGLGMASFWRPDSKALAMSTTCFVEGQACLQLAVLDLYGQVILDGSMLPELKGLEFICHSPDGRRIAALRPMTPRVGGRDGGILVEVDPERQTVQAVAEVPPALACRNLGRFERLVAWNSDGHCQLAQ